MIKNSLKNNLIQQNPHWQGELATFVKRDELDKLVSYLPLRQIITITGVRRCGKSSLAKQAVNYLIEIGVSANNIIFMNLEQPYFLEQRHNADYLTTIYDTYLQLCNPQGRVYVIFDEVQYFDNWQVYVKSQYERSDTKFIITGSNSSMLSNELATLLSGRSLNIHLDTFSFVEFLRFKQISYENELVRITNKIAIARAKEEYLRWGGFFEVFSVEDEVIKKDILIGYVKNIIYQDIIPRHKIRNNEALERLFFYLLANPCTVLNYTTLSKTFNISDKTIKEYLNYFEQVFLFKYIDKFHNKAKERIKSKKKLFVLDNGLLQIAVKHTKDLGSALENWVFNILNSTQNQLYYIHNTQEIDFYADKILYQVCYDLNDEKTKQREMGAFKGFGNVKKLITFDENTTINEIEVLSIDEFLL